jgi:hypothetical protein
VQSPSDDVTTVFPLPPAVVTLDEGPLPERTVTEFPPVVDPDTPFGPAVTELVMLPSPPLLSPLCVSTCLQPSLLSDEECDIEPPDDDEEDDEEDCAWTGKAMPTHPATIEPRSMLRMVFLRWSIK